MNKELKDKLLDEKFRYVRRTLRRAILKECRFDILYSLNRLHQLHAGHLRPDTVNVQALERTLEPPPDSMCQPVVGNDPFRPPLMTYVQDLRGYIEFIHSGAHVLGEGQPIDPLDPAIIY